MRSQLVIYTQAEECSISWHLGFTPLTTPLKLLRGVAAANELLDKLILVTAIIDYQTVWSMCDYLMIWKHSCSG